MGHLRRKHCSETVSDARLREYLLNLPAAAEARFREEQTKILDMCHSTMTTLLTQAREIQDGVVFGEEFRQPAQGVPYALLKTFQLIVAFICAVPLLLADVQAFYRHDVFQEGVKSLAQNSEFQERFELLKAMALDMGSLMRSAERALIASEDLRKDADVVQFFGSSGAHGLAMQTICNILREPVYNNMNVAELYGDYEADLVSTLPHPCSHVYLTNF
ncbi:hypothetical protein B0I35DRAFT_163792 [Stachybotrys elegans]|uniref:Uncharacterized protein n=1 Tax=Stachybotrys elegans TaxID=80388 RepID=A0A8K0T0U6_9HYPO|nr:hypothetical protein B0I35DRAFT_163792 [Stachybotrys elegans]